jgi:RNA ligase (TIGR02306 family)
MIKIEEVKRVIAHPNADKLDLIAIDGYQYVTQKGLYNPGDYVLTIPEEHDVSNYPIIMEEYNILEDGIVRRVKLRDQISQGIIVSEELLEQMGFQMDSLPKGEDLSELLKIPEWIRPIPPELVDVIEHYKHPLTLYQDCVYPAVSDIKQGDSVVYTEKFHGSQCNIILTGGMRYISSKGLLKDKFVFLQGVKNKYTLAADKLDLSWVNPEDYVQIVGEVIPFFKGYSYGRTDAEMLIFAIYINGEYRDPHRLLKGKDCVPVINAGPFDGDFAYNGPKYSLLDENTLCEGWCIAKEGCKPVKVKSPYFLKKNVGEE